MIEHNLCPQNAGSQLQPGRTDPPLESVVPAGRIHRVGRGAPHQPGLDRCPHTAGPPKRASPGRLVPSGRTRVFHPAVPTSDYRTEGPSATGPVPRWSTTPNESPAPRDWSALHPPPERTMTSPPRLAITKDPGTPKKCAGGLRHLRTDTSRTQAPGARHLKGARSKTLDGPAARRGARRGARARLTLGREGSREFGTARKPTASQEGRQSSCGARRNHRQDPARGFGFPVLCQLPSALERGSKAFIPGGAKSRPRRLAAFGRQQKAPPRAAQVRLWRRGSEGRPRAVFWKKAGILWRACPAVALRRRCGG